MSLFLTYTTGLYNTLLSAAESKRLRMLSGEKWMLDLPDGDKLSLLLNEASSNVQEHVVIVVHGLAGAAMDPPVVSVTEKFLQEGYAVVRMNLRGSGYGAGYARNIYHAGRDEDLEFVVNAVARRFPERKVSMVSMSLSSNMMFRYMAKTQNPVLNRAVALSPVIDLARASRQLSHAYFGMINRAVLNILKSYFVKRKRAYQDTNVPDWRVIKRLHQFDSLFIAPEFGFESAEHYYQSSTAIPYLEKIQSPWRAAISLDDPIAISEKRIFSKEFPANTSVLRSGGHLFFKKHGGLGEIAFKTFKEMA